MDSIVEFYSRIYWENKSDSLRTPLGKTNLNKMDSAIKLLDTRTVALYAETVRLDEVKADKTQLNGMIVNWEFDQTTGIIKITRYDGAVSAINTTLNKLAVNFIYDAINEKLIITQTDGTEVEVDMSALITQYEFLDTDTVSFSVDANGKVSAIIKEGSIGEKHLNPDYLAEIKIEVAKAQGYAANAQESANNSAYEAKLAQSYSVGGSGVRDGEDSDNSKHYYELTKNIADNANIIESLKTTYQISPDGKEVPSGAWQQEIPEIQQGMFLWTKIVIEYSNGNNSTFYSAAYSGVDGAGGSGGGIIQKKAYLADDEERFLLTADGQAILLPEYSQDIIPNSAKVLQNYFDDTAVTEINTFASSNITEKSVIFSLVDSTINPGIDGMLTFFWKKEMFNTLQMGFIMNKSSHLKFRGRGNDGLYDWEDWKTILDSGNFSEIINSVDNVLYTKKGTMVGHCTAGSSHAGFINFARIKILDNYANHTCYFTIQNRGIYFPIILSIGFQNINHTDPGLISFLYWGATDYGIYAVKNTTSTWDLYVKKTEVHDVVEILQLNYDAEHFEITFPNGFAAEKGGDWMSPQPGGRVAGADHVYDTGNGAIITASYSKLGMTRGGITWLACWDGYEICAINKNVFTYLKKLDHYGMCIPYEDGSGQNDQEWIRTTNNGIIPYSANSSEGKSSLGTETWPFAECYSKKIVTNQIHASNDFRYTQSSSGHTIIDMTGSHINFTSTGATTHGISIQTSPSNLRVSIHPLTDAAADLGRSDRLWRNIYANNAVIQTSDKNKKKDISYIGEESEYENTKMSDDTLVKFVRSLRPCIFLMKDGESGRPHHGFISQDFKKTMDELGIQDHAAYIKSPKTETVEKEVEQEREVYDEIEKETKTIKETVKIQEEKVIPGKFIEGLRYEEVIPDITRFCQLLYQQNQEQQELINSQQKEMNDLKIRLEILEKIVI